MGFFESYFHTEYHSEEEAAVTCPFPHHTSTGLEYFESNPSAHVSTRKRVFHCKVCDQGYNELSFITTVLSCSYADAMRLIKLFNNIEDTAEWDKYSTLDDAARQMCRDLGISDAVIDELKLSSICPGTVSFPAFMYDHLMDIRTYAPGGTPKIKSRAGSPSGLVIPLQLWEQTPLNRMTCICAGEKDMAVARSHGFNAITITGGEMSLPLSPVWFKDRDVCILYDNDNAGRVGAVKLATYLLEYCHSVKVCTGFHAVCKEDKEDITDFFTKYNGTREQLIAYMNDTQLFTKEDAIAESTLPLLTLSQATTPEHINKMVRSNVQVVAVSEVQYVVPTVMTGEKLKETGNDGMSVGDIKSWTLDERTVQDILKLTDNNFSEQDIQSNAKALLGISPKEKYVHVSKLNKIVVYKAYVTDMFESMHTDTMPMEYTVYSLGTRLESGKKYLVTHKLVPHPYKGQQITMIITNAVQASDSVSGFKLTPEVVANLSLIQGLQGTVPERMDMLTQKVKGLLGYNGNDTLIQIIDLAYHTVLSFNFGQFKNVRGYLDTLVVGESRVGKSSTANALREAYQLGTFTSLAGNSATVAGLIGGSNKTAGGGFQTKAGIIPQNHKGLIIFEEFGKCDSNIVTELTDIRSSNEVRITRVSGTLNLPACVRMISLSNVKAARGEIKSIASYPNGISIITELVSTAEDIARYDLLAVLSDRGSNTVDPFWIPEDPLPADVMQTRVRWVWSRTPEQINISDEVGRYIISKSNELNRLYNCHIKIFGTEAWKKLSRLAIAVAGYLVSADPTYTQIVVTQEHVDYAVSMFIRLYDNPTFRLREYVENEKKYNEIDDTGVQLLQNLYIKVPQLLIMLEQESSPARQTLMAAAGLDIKEYNAFMSELIRGSFVKLNSMDVIPTERFRQGMARIDKNASLRRLGENYADMAPPDHR